MKKRTFLVLALIVAILGLFAACGDSRKSKLTAVSGTTLGEKLQWLASNAVNNTGYLLEVTAAHEELAPQNLSYSGSNITIRLRGRGNERVVSPSGNGSLFTINNGVTLILENITLAGAGGSNNALVHINSGGSLELNQGAKIAGNTGDGVNNYGGTLTMTDGEISGNTIGVRNGAIYTAIDREYVTINGILTINGGKISGNTDGGVSNQGTITMTGGEISGNNGVGVYNNGGILTMTGGKISGNTSASFDGGGVHNGVIYTIIDGAYGAVNGTFTMNGGEISGNTSSNGGGVCNHGIFTIEDGKIFDNNSSIGGGVDNHGTFTMNGGKISGNTALLYGGGVSNTISYTYAYDKYVPDGTFTMKNGEISDNTASSYGDGIFVSDGAVFEKIGGTINNNTVYAYHDINDYIKQKETNSGPGDNLLYNGKRNPPVWSGKWDN